MTSLKAFVQKMDKLTGASGDRLYERVRSLVRLGVLHPIPGRGPGRGTPLNASNLSALIISLMETDNWADVDARVAQLCEAAPSPGPTCPFTGARNFRDALAEIIGSTKRAKLTLSLSVNREKLEPEILYMACRKPGRSLFRPKPRPLHDPFISSVVTVSPYALLTLAELLKHELSENDE
jgi:hypothetical protein